MVLSRRPGAVVRRRRPACTRSSSSPCSACCRWRPAWSGWPCSAADGSILLLALLGRLWHLSTREVCLWLARWPALAAACGLPPGRVIHPAHLARRVRRLGPYPFWLLSLVLVWRAIQAGLVLGRDVVLDSTLLAAWTRGDPDAAWSYPSAAKGRVFGSKVHVLLDRLARLPICFLLSPAHRNDLPFAYPLLWFARFVLRLPIHMVRADGASWGVTLVRWIVTVLLRVTLTFCAILVVALAAHQAGAPELRLSPTRVLAHYQPIEAPL